MSLLLNTRQRAAVSVFIGLWFVVQAGAGVQLPNTFSDHAVLQRDRPVPIWGQAEPGENVTVQFAGQTKSATAGPDGKWRVMLDPLAAGGPFVLTVTGKNSIHRDDILVGDVWFCAGQSNMGTTLAGSQYLSAEAPGATNSDVRYFNMGGNSGYAAATPQADVPDQWRRCTPVSALSFPAIGYFFAKQIHHETGIPIGMIKCSSWGSPAEPFVSRDVLQQTPLFKPLLEKLTADMAHYQTRQEAYEKAYAEKLSAYQNDEKKCAAIIDSLNENDSSTDFTSWNSVTLPGSLDKPELKGHASTVWLRKNIPVPDRWTGQDLVLQAGLYDDPITVYFNGTELTRTNEDFGYPVPAKLWQAGTNSIAVRIVSLSGGQIGLGRFAFLMQLAPATGKEPVSLTGDWRYKLGATFPAVNPPHQPTAPISPDAERSAPGAIYNAMVAPWVGYGIKGVLWYQGESNADHAPDYATLFPLLINSWRKAWGRDFPLLYVQLPNFLGAKQPKDYTPPAANAGPDEFPIGWAAMREVQLHSLAVSNTAMVVTIDCGATWNIHPNNKKIVAERLVRAALSRVYGRTNESSGPVYDSMKIDGHQVRLKFKYSGQGLVAKDGPLKQFAIAGDDHKFVWAEAKIEAPDTVLVSSDKIQSPVAVRYAFSGDPQGANLYNDAQLPASPFRTDDWELPPPQ